MDMGLTWKKLLGEGMSNQQIETMLLLGIVPIILLTIWFMVFLYNNLAPELEKQLLGVRGKGRKSYRIFYMTAVNENEKKQLVLDYCQLRMGQITRGDVNEIAIRCGYLTANGDLSDSCLLYTSPSPRDATLSRMPSSA